VSEIDIDVGEENINCVRTLRLNRKNIPLEVKTKKLKKGEKICQNSRQVTVMKWCDKKTVTWCQHTTVMREE
jgi:hypothetical protein